MDEVIDFIGCLASIHGIIGIVYGLWYQKLTGKPPPPTTQVKPTTNTTPILALMNVGIEDPYDVSDLLDDSVAPAAKSAAAKAQAKSAAKTDNELDAEHTKKRITDRNVALRFTSSPTLAADTAGIRICSTPVFTLMHRHLEQCGAK
jgi:hypothetical protein